MKSKTIEIINQIYQEVNEPIGRPGKRVQVDESVIARNNILRIPTSRDDVEVNTVWLLGGIEENDMKKFFLILIPNIQIATLTAIIRNKVLPATILVTDGYPSYPSVARNLGFTDICVPHSLNQYVNERGDHNNIIEAFWSLMKHLMRSRHGILTEKIPEFMKEYAFRRRFIPQILIEEKENALIANLKKMFN